MNGWVIRAVVLLIPSQGLHLCGSQAQLECPSPKKTEMLQNCSTKVHSPPSEVRYTGQDPPLPCLQLSSVNLLSVHSGKAQYINSYYLILLKHLKTRASIT